METTILTVTDRHGRTKQFYNSDKHIKGDTRIKNRCDGYDYIWQYLMKDDYDGTIMHKCIAIDSRELADLQEREVKNYRCNYIGGVHYEITLEKFLKWAHPVEGKFGSQMCVSWRHWTTNEGETKKVKKPKREKKVMTVITPAPQAIQMGLF